MPAAPWGLALAAAAAARTPVPATVDRIEGDIAVIELDTETFLDLPARRLPPGTREGDRLRLRIRRGAPAGDRPRTITRARPLAGPPGALHEPPPHH
jgi:hypothetical protein